MMPPRVLIISISLGSGHARAGQAVIGKLVELEPATQARMIDLADYLSAPLRPLYVGGYMLMVRHLAPVWGFLYDHPPLHGGTLPRGLLWRSIGRVRELVAEFRPNVLLATQITSCEVASLLVERGLSPAAVTVITDYDSHPAWKLPRIERFFVADETIREGMIRLGIPPERVAATGIPVHDEFERPLSRAEARARLGLRPDVPVALLMGGSLGLGRILGCVAELMARNRPLQIAAVAGHNRDLREALERLRPPPDISLRVLGYVDNVHELMAAADVFVSKPGGVSMTEALQVGLPIVAVDGLRGQEAANARHLSNAGCVRVVSKGEGAAPVIEELLHSGGADLREAASRYRKRGAARAIAAELLHLAATQQP